MLREGQGILGRITFADGVFPEYDRTYLVASVSDEIVGVLNVSSVKDKSASLLLPTNRYINNQYPPFLKKSFVKLDSYVEITVNEALSLRVLANGETLDAKELHAIKKVIIY